MGIDIVQACGDDQGIHGGGALLRIVRQADPAIGEEARECVGTSEKIVHGLGNGIFGRHASATLPHPVEQLINQRHDVYLTDSQPVFCGRTVDGTFGLEYGVDPTHGLYGEGCLVPLGDFEQLSASVRPAVG